MVPVESVLRGAMAWKSVTVMFAAGLPLIRIVNRGGERNHADSKTKLTTKTRSRARIRERFIGLKDLYSKLVNLSCISLDYRDGKIVRLAILAAVLIFHVGPHAVQQVSRFGPSVDGHHAGKLIPGHLGQVFGH